MPTGIYPRSTYHRRITSESGIGRIVTEKTRKKISDARKGMIFSVTHRKHLSDAHKGQISWMKGKHPTKETLKKSSESHKGDHCNWWKGGITPQPYCEKWTPEFRERVRAFFNYTCQLCGHVWQPGERRLAVHHVKYNKMVCCDDSPRLFIPV
jgi:hypothetical protein